MVAWVSAGDGFPESDPLQRQQESNCGSLVSPHLGQVIMVAVWMLNHLHLAVACAAESMKAFAVGADELHIHEFVGDMEVIKPEKLL